MSAYTAVIDARQLEQQVRAVLANAAPYARELGVIVQGAARATTTTVRQADQVLNQIKGAPARLYRTTIRRLQGRAAAAPPPAVVPPIGLRDRAVASPATRPGLRSVRLRPLSATAARKLASGLVRPAPARLRIGPLLSDRARASPTPPSITVAAAAMRSPTVILTVLGPGGYHAETPLDVGRGVAAARVRLPARTGRYRLTIADLDSPTPRAAVAAINSRR